MTGVSAGLTDGVGEGDSVRVAAAAGGIVGVAVGGLGTPPVQPTRVKSSKKSAAQMRHRM